MLGTGDRGEKKEEKTFCYYGGLKVKYPSLGPLHLNTCCTVGGTVCELWTIWQVETYFRKYVPWGCAWVQMQYDQQAFCSLPCMPFPSAAVPTHYDGLYLSELNVSINKLFLCYVTFVKVFNQSKESDGDSPHRHRRSRIVEKTRVSHVVCDLVRSCTLGSTVSLHCPSCTLTRGHLLPL